MRPIREVAEAFGIDPQKLRVYGEYIAKVPLDAFPQGGRQAALVLVTGMTPTPAGEGKTTTAIGLVDGLARLGKRAALTLRQPSMGPVFGSKGGGTGGGKARVVPDDEINFHFTGDAHAVASAHNLLAALTDNALYRGQLTGVDANGMVWGRVTNIGDRALRRVTVGLDGAGGVQRQSFFSIDAASELMAVLALAAGWDDLRARLERVVVAFTNGGQPVTAKDVGAVDSMLTLLRHAVQPNLVQTLEGQPALVHAGPFGNIAHGCSSVLASRLGLACADYVVTESGFAADLGFEKHMHIVARSSGLLPRAAVVVVTTRALKWHGGAARNELGHPNAAALEQGFENLAHVLGIVQGFGVPAVVTLNRFANDSSQEVATVLSRAKELGAAAAVENRAYLDGGTGATGLAEAVVEACRAPSRPTYLYELAATTREKVRVLATRLYGAARVEWASEAVKQVERIEALGWGTLPVCMAKTPLSLSHDPNLRGRPTGYAFPITGAHISAGAGFIYLLAGSVQTLPGLPARPNALGMNVDSHGNIIGAL
ncbi:MAG: formate--tetrahydrofolate ligase [Dehalococcoidia bacterium]|nr:formate--tetrahydrofolate ligase [Dehalococcoidia bacterium]